MTYAFAIATSGKIIKLSSGIKGGRFSFCLCGEGFARWIGEDEEDVLLEEGALGGTVIAASDISMLFYMRG